MPNMVLSNISSESILNISILDRMITDVEQYKREICSLGMNVMYLKFYFQMNSNMPSGRLYL